MSWRTRAASPPFARAAEARNVEVTPLDRYCRGPLKRQGLKMGFAAVDAKTTQDLEMARACNPEILRFAQDDA